MATKFAPISFIPFRRSSQIHFRFVSCERMLWRGYSGVGDVCLDDGTCTSAQAKWWGLWRPEHLEVMIARTQCLHVPNSQTSVLTQWSFINFSHIILFLTKPLYFHYLQILSNSAYVPTFLSMVPQYKFFIPLVILPKIYTRLNVPLLEYIFALTKSSCYSWSCVSLSIFESKSPLHKLELKSHIGDKQYYPVTV